MLAQDDEQERERVIAYNARRLNQVERNYPTIEKECLAMVRAIQKFKQYLRGWILFTVFTDHAALKILMKHEYLLSKRARWMEILALYHFKIQHRPGKKMVHANYLSRLYQGQIEYPWNRKDTKFILNVLYTKKGVYGLERYKNPIEGLIQIPCEKVDKGKTSYQVVCRKTREETGIYTAPKYLTKDDKFNCNIYTINITEEEKSQWMESEKNGL